MPVAFWVLTVSISRLWRPRNRDETTATLYALALLIRASIIVPIAIGLVIRAA